MKLQGATPPTRDPETSRSFARALTRGDLDAATACFTRDGCLITPDATAIHGRRQIRLLLAQMVLQRIEIEVELSSTILAGDVVLARERWQVRAAGPDGGSRAQTLRPTLVLRLIEEAWKLSVLAPWQAGRPLP
ncbi:MAG: YybH family protein [Solirubrobacterales bacterium]